MDNRIRDAAGLIKVGERRKAYALLLQVLREQPQNATAWVMIAGLQEDRADQMTSLQRALGAAQKVPDAENQRAAQRAQALIARLTPPVGWQELEVPVDQSHLPQMDAVPVRQADSAPLKEPAGALDRIMGRIEGQRTNVLLGIGLVVVIGIIMLGLGGVYVLNTLRSLNTPAVAEATLVHTPTPLATDTPTPVPTSETDKGVLGIQGPGDAPAATPTIVGPPQDVIVYLDRVYQGYTPFTRGLYDMIYRLQELYYDPNLWYDDVWQTRLVESMQLVYAFDTEMRTIGNIPEDLRQFHLSMLNASRYCSEAVDFFYEAFAEYSINDAQLGSDRLEDCDDRQIEAEALLQRYLEAYPGYEYNPTY